MNQRKLTSENLERALEIYLDIANPTWKNERKYDIEDIIQKIAIGLKFESIAKISLPYNLPERDIYAPNAHLCISRTQYLKEVDGTEYLLRPTLEKPSWSKINFNSTVKGEAGRIEKEIESAWVKENYPIWTEYQM